MGFNRKLLLLLLYLLIRQTKTIRIVGRGGEEKKNRTRIRPRIGQRECCLVKRFHLAIIIMSSLMLQQPAVFSGHTNCRLYAFYEILQLSLFWSQLVLSPVPF